MLPFVTVIVPGHDATGTLEACLQSLVAQDYPRERYEIAYVDDASTDDSPEVAARYADRVITLKGRPLGPAAARNRGVRETSGEIVLFLDADVVAQPTTISALIQPLLNEPNLAAIFGSYDREPEHRAILSQYRNLLHHYVHQMSGGNAETFWAGCGAIRRAAFEKVGGFNFKRYRTPMVEDIELGHRLRAAGMRIRLDRTIQVKHLKKWTSLGMIRADIFARGIPWMRLLLSEREKARGIGDLNLKLRDLLSVLLAWGAVTLLLAGRWIPSAGLWAVVLFGCFTIINFSTYAFFWRIRGLRFTIMVLPLHHLFYFCNGVSVVGALAYLVLFDRPPFGLRRFGKIIQRRYWDHLDRRLGPLPAEAKNEPTHSGR